MTSIPQRINQLNEYVRLLQGLRGRDFEDPYVKGALERYFQLAAECVLDIGEMLISQEDWPKARSYRDVIRVLGDKGVLEPDFATSFEGIAGLRNILVHDYVNVSVERLEALLDELDDFQRFTTSVAKYVDDATKK